MKINAKIAVLVILLVVFVYLGRSKLAVIHSNWGVDYSKRHEYDKAINYFKISLKIDPSLFKTHYSLAEAYELKGAIDEAIAEYKETIRLSPKLTEAYMALAPLYLKKEMYQDTIELLKQAENNVKDPREIKEFGGVVIFEYLSTQLNKSIDAYLSGNKAEAFSILNGIVKDSPDYKYAYYILGYFYCLEKKYAEAENYLRESIRIDPKSWEAYKLIGDIHFEKNDYDGADKEYKKALSINNRNSFLYNELGLQFMARERYGQAVWYLQKAVELSPDNINMRYSLASIYRDNHQFNDAIAWYNKVNSSQPDYPNLHNDIGDIYRNLNKNTEAEEEYRKEINYCDAKLLINPKDAVSMNDMAYAYNKLGEFNKAKQLIEKALIAMPGYKQAYLLLAEINKNLQQEENALAALNKAGTLLNNDKKGAAEINKEFVDMIKNKLRLASIDTIYLKNGRKLTGKVKLKEKDRVVVEIVTSNSRGTITLNPEDIKTIVGTGSGK